MYIAQEYLAGGPIDAIASKSSDWNLVLSLGKDLLDALAYAHSQKVVHRDVKPSNILFVLPPDFGARPRAKLIDFGFGKVLTPANAPMTAKGVALALPFMSPEHVNDFRNVGFAGDVYGAAATIFHLLTGESHLVDATPTGPNPNYQIVMAILSKNRRKLARLRPDMPEQLTQAIDGLLETDASKRSETPAVQFRRLIARFV